MSINKLAYDRGSDLYGVSFALQAIGNLLGADACEHAIDASDSEGLAHAVVALGVLVKVIGGDLCEAFDPDELNKSAPRNAHNEIVARDSEVLP